MMYFSYKDLVKEYVNCKISVDIQELREAGLLESFMDDVERLSPTKSWNDHRTDLQTVIKEEKNRAKYFSLIKTKTLDDKTTYPIVSNYYQYPVGHLQEDIPSVDMESLLAE